jgi:hypothetical protein
VFPSAKLNRITIERTLRAGICARTTTFLLVGRECDLVNRSFLETKRNVLPEPITIAPRAERAQSRWSTAQRAINSTPRRVPASFEDMLCPVLLN